MGTSNTYLNEEEVKTKYVIPVLTKLGFSIYQNMQFEKRICSTNDFGKIKIGRADILIKVNNEYILIEAKNSRVNIRSDKCLNQVIKYCENHKPIIRYGMLIKNNDITFVDVINKRFLSKKTEGFEYLKKLESQIIHELNDQHNIIKGFSRDDIKQIADMQRRSEISLLLGNEKDADRIALIKFIPSVYTQRLDLNDRFNKYLHSEMTAFALIGDAGMGKTNFMCDIASVLGKENISFFFNGFSLTGNITQRIVGLFSKKFPDCEFDSLMQRIFLSLEPEENIYIFIDGINECPTQREELRADLNDICLIIKNYPIKLAISCRTLDWPFWYDFQGKRKSYLSQLIFKKPNERDSYKIIEFNDNEFEVSWAKYKNTFNLKGIPSNRMKDMCKEPFMLRLVAEVYKDGKTLPEYIEPLELFHRYFVEKYPDPQIRFKTMRFLNWLAERILEKGEPFVNIIEVPHEQDHVCHSLLDEKIIIRMDEDENIHFNFELFLEYIMSQYILNNIIGKTTRATEKINKVIELTKNNLTNMPGVIENIILSWQYDLTVVEDCLRDIIKLGQIWETIACSTIRKIGNVTKTMDSIILRLASSRDFVNRLFISQVLTKYLNSYGWGIILTMSNSSDWESRETAANVIGYENKVKEEAIDVLNKLSEDLHWRVRRSAGYALQEILKKDPKAKALDGFFEDVEKLSPQKKYIVCISLAGANYTFKHAILNVLSVDKDPQVRWAIAHYLPRYDEDIRNNITELLINDNDSWIRAKLVESLTEIINEGRPDFQKYLFELVNDSSEMVKVRIARKIAEIDDLKYVNSILSKLFQDNSPTVLYASYHTAMERGINSLDSDIMAEKFDEDTELFTYRERVARKDINLSSGNLRITEDYIYQRAEFEYRSDPYMDIISVMWQIITQAIENIGMEYSRILRFFEILSNETDEGIRWALVWYVAKYGSEFLKLNDTIAILMKLAQDNHPWIRREVAISIGDMTWENEYLEKVIEILKKIKRDEPTESYLCSLEVQYFLDQSLEKLKL